MAFGTKRLVFIITGSDQLTPILKKIQGQAVTTSEKMKSAGKLMTKAITLPVLAAGAASIKMATDFEASMRRVQTQAGGSAKDVATLSKQVLQLGLYAEQSPKQLADSMFHLKSVGLDNVNAMKALKTSADLAAVGNSNLEDTTNALAGAWRSGIKGSQNFTQAAASLNAIVGAGNLKMQDLVNAIGTGFLPTARSFGLSINQVGAALALMTDEGIPAQKAATRLRTAMVMMGAPTNKAADALSSIGIGANGLAKAMRSPGGIYAAMQLLQSHIKKAGLNSVETARLIATAFGGARTGSAILTLYNNMEVLRKKQIQINGTMGKFGPAVAAQRKSAAAQFALLKSSIDVTAVRLGQVLLPMAVAVTKQFNKFVTVFANIPGPAQKAIIAMLGIAAVVGPILVLTAKMIEAVRVIKEWSVVQAILNVELDANPIGAIILGITALIAVVIVVIKYHKQLWQIAQNVWNWLRAHQWVLLFAGVIGIIAEIGMHWRGIKTIAVNVWHAIYTVWHAVSSAIVSDAQAMWNGGLKQIFGFIAKVGKFAFYTVEVFAGIAWDIVSGLALAAWFVIKKVFGWIEQVALHVFNDVIAPVAKFAWGIVTAYARANWVVIKAIFGFIEQVAKHVFNDVLAPVGKFAWKVISVSAQAAWNNVIHPVFNFIASVAKTIWNAVSKAASSTWNWIVARARWVQTNIRSVFSSIWMKISGVFGNIINGAARAFSWVPGLGPKLRDAANKFNTFRNRVNNAINGVKSKTVNVGVAFTAGGTGSNPLLHPTHKAAGGKVWGAGTSTSDSVPAMLSNGEYVVKASSVAKYGTGFMNMVNAGKYAGGGLIPNAKTPGVKAIDDAVWGGLTKYAGSQVNSLLGAIGSMGDSGVRSASAAKAQAFARSMMGRFGWNANQMAYLIPLWNQESGWSAYAVNASSGAYGIPQSLGHGHPYNLGDYIAQVMWGLTYIRGRYGSPASAWAHERAFNWYSKGGPVPTQSFDTGRGVLRPGYTLAHNGTGRNEFLSTGGGGITINVNAGAILGTKREVARYVSEALQEYKGKGGRIP